MTKEKETYMVQGQCSNCDYQGPISFQKGKSADFEKTECPECGCKTLSKFQKIDIDFPPIRPRKVIPLTPYDKPWIETFPHPFSPKRHFPYWGDPPSGKIGYFYC